MGASLGTVNRRFVEDEHGEAHLGPPRGHPDLPVQIDRPTLFASFSARIPRPSKRKLLIMALTVVLLASSAAFVQKAVLKNRSVAWYCVDDCRSIACLVILNAIGVGGIFELESSRVQGMTALELATHHKDLDVWRFLVDTLHHSPHGLLEWACKHNRRRSIEWLVNVAKVDVTHTRLTFVDPIHPDQSPFRNTTLLGLAAFYNRTNIADWVVTEGVLAPNAVDASGKAMHFNAVIRGHLSYLKWIRRSFCPSLESPGCHNMRIFDLAAGDFDGYTIAHTAAHRGERAILNWIASDASGVNHILESKTQFEESVLHTAVHGLGNPSFVEHMLGKHQKRMLWTDLDSEGSSVMHYAAKRGDVSILALLRRILGKQHSHLFTQPNKNGITPFAMCSMANKTSCHSWFVGEFDGIISRTHHLSGAHVAAMYGHVAPLQWHAHISLKLLTSESLRDKQPPVWYAKENCRHEVVNYLRTVIGRNDADSNDEWMEKCPQMDTLVG